jgi:hypothetical protein
VKPRKATSVEQQTFLKRLGAMLDRTKARLAALSTGDYELRVVTVRGHDVVGHTRNTFTRPYLARVKKP